jgi:hypothetical protein
MVTTASTAIASPTHGAPLFVDGSDASTVYWAQYTGSYQFTKSLVNDIYLSSEGVSFEFEVPIAQWSSNIQMADRAVEEFASNNGTWDADVTASGFVSGPGGSSMGGALSSARTKRVQYVSAIQATDVFVFEVAEATGNTWTQLPTVVNGTEIAQFAFFNNTGTETNGGVRIKAVAGSSTQVDVSFQRYASTSADVSSIKQNWPTGRWRLRKVSAGAVVGIGQVVTERYHNSAWAGYGATATQIPYMSGTADVNTTGALVTVGNDSTNGMKFTASRRCRVSLNLTYRFTSSSGVGGVSLNANSVTTSVDTLSTAYRKHRADCVSTSLVQALTWSGILEVGDILRPHFNATGLNSTASQGEVDFTAESII